VTQEQIYHGKARNSVREEPSDIQKRDRVRFRGALSAMLTPEYRSVPRSALSYDPPVRSESLFVNTALLSYRPKSSLEVAFRRDQLPTGVNFPDLTIFV
jgi:hypothetical protein